MVASSAYLLGKESKSWVTEIIHVFLQTNLVTEVMDSNSRALVTKIIQTRIENEAHYLVSCSLTSPKVLEITDQ